MSDTTLVQVGNKGRIVIPASIRSRHQWVEGSALVALDTEVGVLFADQGTVERLVRSRLAGHDLLDELLSDRRREAGRENELPTSST